MEKVYLVTGGSSGIGLEIASRLKDGKVYITGRREEKLIESVEELKAKGIDADYFQGDLSDDKRLIEIFETIKEEGQLAAVINSAGVSGVGIDVETTLKIDLRGSALLIEEAKKIAGPGTVIAMISSMMGYAVPPNPQLDPLLADPLKEENFQAAVAACNGDSAIAYNLAKRGVHLMVEKHADELGKLGTRIVSVSPGIIMTPMAKAAAEDHPERMAFMEQMTPCKRNGEPEDIANAVEFLISPLASFITGADLRVDGGLVLNFPKIAAMMGEG
ncbi:MAG: SDR family oxidoreductase [Tissierellia bacterium]|nr:SDR family oxidoreductase [Tissierellia bacterium]